MKWRSLGIVFMILSVAWVGCSSDDNGEDEVLPVVTGITPEQVCSTGGEITVTGTGFLETSVVSIGIGADSADLATVFVDEQTLTATVPDPTSAGSYDVTVTNPDGADTLVGALTVNANPVVYFVDPFTLYNGITLQVTVHGPDAATSLTEIHVFPDGGGSYTSVEFTQDAGGRVQAVVPSGLTPGSYSLSVTDQNGCVGTLEGAFVVVETLTLVIDKVELPFGWTDDRTGVNIYSVEEPGAGMENFQATPRFYLNPADAGAGTVASELRHTAYVSPTRASSIVPAGLPTGMYDLIAVNPTGAIGLLEDAFEVTALPPPVIEALLPPSVVNQETQEITIAGANFRTPAFEGECLQPDGSLIPLAGTILASDETSIRVEFDFITQVVMDGSICVMKVTNDDGTYTTYSALGITNPSLNLESFTVASSLNTARRAPCAVAGEAAPGARFVYTLGGDDGIGRDTDATTVYDTVEMAAVDPFGDLGEWSVLLDTLPEPRSFHSCTAIDRFVYVLGGSAGAGAVNSVWRAKILDPEKAPEIDAVDLFVDPEQSAVFAPGRYVYRVSARFPVDHPINPGGESLAGNATLIQTPDIAEKVSVTIGWTPVAGASGYLIYRTPEPGQAAGSERLLAEVGDVAEYVDDGSVTPAGAQPLPLGALGMFADLPAMGVAREGAGLAVAADPDGADTLYLYMAGGRDDTGAGLASLEWLDVQIAADGTQTSGDAWTVSNADMGDARWQLGTWTADHQSAPDLVAEGESWVYVGGGIEDGFQFMVPTVMALQVETGGVLGETDGTYYEVDEMQPFKSGYAAAIFNNQLFAFGGTQGMANTECNSVEMCGLVAGACSAQIPDPPDLANWNSLGIDMTIARYLPAGVTVSPFVFVIGGVDDGVPPVPLAAVGKTLW